jgi:hypothetical protein
MHVPSTAAPSNLTCTKIRIILQYCSSRLNGAGLFRLSYTIFGSLLYNNGNNTDNYAPLPSFLSLAFIRLKNCSDISCNVTLINSTDKWCDAELLAVQLQVSGCIKVPLDNVSIELTAT